MTEALSVKSLRKSYGKIRAVDDISFNVNPNEIVGLLGPNGAGKTTTINMLLGVLEPESGSIRIEGLDLKFNRSQAISRANFATTYTLLPGNLTVRENLKVFCNLYGVKNIPQRVDEVIKRFDLEAFRDKKCGVLSSGEQTRAGLAKAMLNKPHLLLLDEPTASLDPSTARDMRRKILEYVKQEAGAVLWTSHNMYEVEDVCDRVLFLSRGRILLEGNPKTLPSQHGRKTLEELFIKVAREHPAPEVF